MLLHLVTNYDITECDSYVRLIFITTTTTTTTNRLTIIQLVIRSTFSEYFAIHTLALKLFSSLVSKLCALTPIFFVIGDDIAPKEVVHLAVAIDAPGCYSLPGLGTYKDFVRDHVQ